MHEATYGVGNLSITLLESWVLGGGGLYGIQLEHKGCEKMGRWGAKYNQGTNKLMGDKYIPTITIILIT